MEAPNKVTCVKCGILIKGGFYNAPSGPQCCNCWERLPKSKIIEEMHSVLDMTKQLQQISIKIQKHS